MEVTQKNKWRLSQHLDCVCMYSKMNVCFYCRVFTRDTRLLSRTVYMPSGQGRCHREPLGFSLVHIALVLQLSGCVYKSFHVSCWRTAEPFRRAFLNILNILLHRFISLSVLWLYSVFLVLFLKTGLLNSFLSRVDILKLRRITIAFS